MGKRSSPPDKFVQNLDILLYVRHFHWLLGVEERERGQGRAVLDVLPSRLQKAANEEDLEESFGILQVLEGRTSLDQFVGNRVKVAGWDVVEMLKELVSKDYEGIS